MRLMESHKVLEGDSMVKGMPFTEHYVIDKHGTVQIIRADRHQRDWQDFELDRGAIVVNEEPLGEFDVPNGRGGYKVISRASVAKRLEKYEDEIAKRRAANLREIEINRANSPESRGKTKAARQVSEAMAEALKTLANAGRGGGDDAAAIFAEMRAELQASREQSAAMAAELAALRTQVNAAPAAPAPTPPGPPPPVEDLPAPTMAAAKRR